MARPLRQWQRILLALLVLALFAAALVVVVLAGPDAAHP